MKTTAVTAPAPQAGGVSVILPTLDEAGNIDQALAAVLAACQRDLHSVSFEVIVVDDGSTDGTRERVRAWECRDLRVRLLARNGERGLASAVLAAAVVATGKVAVVLDADLSHPPELVPTLARAVLSGDCDMAMGSRYVRGGSSPGWPLRRRLLSRSAAALARILVDVRDPGSGFFAVRRDILLETGRAARGFKIGLEILARAGAELRVKEFPITFRDRQQGQSKLGGRVAVTYITQILALAGGAVSAGNACRFALVGLTGFTVDVALYNLFLVAGLSLGVSHLASFAVATVVNYVLNANWALRVQGGAPHRPTLRGYVAFASVALLAVFLRGGVIAQAQHSLLLSPRWAILPAILAAAVVNYLGSVFFVFRPPGRPCHSGIPWRVAAVGGALYLLALRLLYLGTVELLPQEAYYWNYAQHLAPGYLDHPPLVAWLIWLATSLLGQTEVAIRTGAVICSLGALFFAFRFTTNLLDRTHAFVVLLLMTALPFFLGTGFLMTPDAPLVACWAGALYYLERALRGGERWSWLGAGVFVGLGLLSKYTIALVGLATLVYLLVDCSSRHWLRSPWPWAAALLALALFSPVIFWNYQHQWASFNFQGARRWGDAPSFDLPELALYAIALITPVGLVGFLLGLGRAPSVRRFGLIFTLVPLAVFLISSLHNETKLNWTGPVWIAALPFMAVSLLAVPAVLGHRPGVWLQPAWKVTLFVALLGGGAMLHYSVLGLPGLPPAMGYCGMSWSDLGRQVSALEQQVLQQDGKRPLVVGMDKYHLASVLAFYCQGGGGAQRTAAKGLFGGRSLMYDLWFLPQDHFGESMVLVGKERKTLESERVSARFERLEPIAELTVEKQGAVIGTYYARVGRRYGAGTVRIAKESRR